MSTVTFRGAFIRHADLRWEGEAGKFVRLHMTADFSDPVREHMGWEPLAGTIDSAKLSGEIAAQNMILTPNGKELAKYELDLAILSVDDFQVFRLKNEDGESMRTELRFIIRTGQEAAAAHVEQYVAAIGKGPGQLKVAYEKQEVLELAEPAGDEGDDESAEELPDETAPIPEPLRRGRPKKQQEESVQ